MADKNPLSIAVDEAAHSLGALQARITNLAVRNAELELRIADLSVQLNEALQKLEKAEAQAETPANE